MIKMIPDWIYLRSGHPSSDCVAVSPRGAGPLTCDVLSERTARLAGGLAALDVGRGDRVAVLARDGPFLLEVLLACARIHAVLVPLDPRFSELELSLVAADCAPSLLLYEHALVTSAWAVAEGANCPILSIDRQNGDPSDYDRLLRSLPAPPTPVEADHPWVILYNCNQSDALRTATLTHGGILADSIRAALSWESAGNGAPRNPAPLYHSGKFDVCALASLLYGTE